MFAKNQRITKKEHFQLIYKNGFVYNFKCFRVFVLKNNLEKIRASVVVSKKISPQAINRNKIKRKLRHALLSVKNTFPQNLDLLIVVSSRDIIANQPSEIRNILINLGDKLKNRC